MQEIQFIAPVALHDEMLRLRNEKQMDFLESLTGMDWGAADEKDTPEKLRGLGKWNIRGRGALWSGLQSEDDCTSG